MQSAASRALLAIIAVLSGCLLALPSQLNAQNTCSGAQGKNGVYNPSCNNGNPGVVGSSAFIDASMFASVQNPNICAVLKSILTSTSYPSTGTVIDARGLPTSTPPTRMTCTTSNPSPWAGITNPPPSVILLPAGTIVIPSTWVLPNNTTLIGAGDDMYSFTGPPHTTTFATTLQACKPSICSFTGTDIIELGSSGGCSTGCNNISVERLALDGQGQSLNGIVNANAQTGSHVDHVSLYQILGTGLWIEGSASDSGPYSNIIFDTGSFSGTSQTVCANLNGLTGTRGLHQLTCTSETNDAPAAVLLDSSNNSVEDVRIVGFYDGIRVGANAYPPSCAPPNTYCHDFGSILNFIEYVFGSGGVPLGGTGGISPNYLYADRLAMDYVPGQRGSYSLSDFFNFNQSNTLPFYPITGAKYRPACFHHPLDPNCFASYPVDPDDDAEETD
jgi:hypothetical protein